MRHRVSVWMIRFSSSIFPTYPLPTIGVISVSCMRLPAPCAATDAIS